MSEPLIITDHRVICPTCKAEGRRSTVTQGAAYAALVHIPRIYDEDGYLISSPSPPGWQNYTCSNGHQWTVRSDGVTELRGWLPTLDMQTEGVTNDD